MLELDPKVSNGVIVTMISQIDNKGYTPVWLKSKWAKEWMNSMKRLELFLATPERPSTPSVLRASQGSRERLFRSRDRISDH